MIVYAIFSNVLPCGKNILHSGPLIVHTKFRAFLHELPHMESSVSKPQSSAQKGLSKENEMSNGQLAFLSHLWCGMF